MRKIEDHKRVGLWIRVSTEDQVRGESPETHERRARLYAEAKGWAVVDVYRLDAVSGKTVKEHPEAKRMLADVERGHISGLIFSKLARLARNTKELLEFAESFRAYGADLISLAESIDTSSPAGRLFYTMIAAMAQWEREEIAARVAASIPIRAQLGKPLGGATPFGYQWKDKKLVPDPKEAPVRKLLHELFAEHKRLKTVARLLNERGFRTRNGSAFSDTTVARLIQDPTAKGIRRANYTKSVSSSTKAWELKPESEWVLSEVEAVVSEELWEACNAILAGRKQNGKPAAKRTVHLFSGLTFCHCGDQTEKMYVPSGMRKYVCQKCRNKMPVDDLEAVFVEELKAFFLSPQELARHQRSAHDALGDKEGLIGVLDAERVKLAAESEKLYALYINGALDVRGFGERNGPLAARLAQLDDEIPRAQADRDVLRVSLQSQEQIISDARDLYARWADMSPGARRSVVESIVEKITIGVGEVSIDLFYDPPHAPHNTPPVSSTPSANGGSVPPSLAPQSHSQRATEPQGFIAAINWKPAGNSA